MRTLCPLLPAAVLGLVAVACASGTPSPANTPDPSPAGLSPSPVSTAEAGPGNWNRLPDPAAFANASVRHVASVPGGFIATGCTTHPGVVDCDLPAAWRAS